jgi:hypothetical protein
MNKITDGLHARPTRLRILEQLPCDVGQPISLAITPAKQQMAAKAVEYRVNCLIRSNPRMKRESDS